MQTEGTWQSIFFKKKLFSGLLRSIVWMSRDVLSFVYDLTYGKKNC